MPTLGVCRFECSLSTEAKEITRHLAAPSPSRLASSCPRPTRSRTARWLTPSVLAAPGCPHSSEGCPPVSCSRPRTSETPPRGHRNPSRLHSPSFARVPVRFLAPVASLSLDFRLDEEEGGIPRTSLRLGFLFTMSEDRSSSHPRHQHSSEPLTNLNAVSLSPYPACGRAHAQKAVFTSSRPPPLSSLSCASPTSLHILVLLSVGPLLRPTEDRDRQSNHRTLRPTEERFKGCDPPIPTTVYAIWTSLPERAR